MRDFFKRKRADGTYAPTLWTNLRGERVSTGCKDLRAAQAWRRNEERIGADPRHAASQGARLDDAIRDLGAELCRRGRAAGTLDRAKRKMGHYVRLWGADLPLGDIDARLVGEYIDTRLKEPGSRKAPPGEKAPRVQRITIRDELAFLRQTLQIARRLGLYAAHVDDVLPLQWETGHKPRKDFVKFEALGDLLKRVTEAHAAHVLFFCVTGGRLADSYRARREDFDTKRWRVLVRGSKTDGSHRTIPIPEFLRPLVKRLLRDAAGDDLLFRTWPNINRDVKSACGRAGLAGVSTNGLRRTFGHALRTHGFDLDTISKLFGHTTIKLARDVYADVDGDELAEVVKLQTAQARYKKRTG